MRICICLLSLLFVPLAQADETADLRAENARLRTQLEALQKSCPVAAAAATSPAAANPALAAQAPLAPALAAPTAEGSVAPPPVAPAGYKLVPIAPPRPEDRYIATGCGKNTPRSAPWKQATNWSLLQRNMTPAEVEELLGPEHYNVESKGRIGWQYGKCEYAVRGTVVFENGHVVVWEKPIF